MVTSLAPAVAVASSIAISTMNDRQACNNNVIRFISFILNNSGYYAFGGKYTKNILIMTI